jgi:hypothetical protein
LVAAFERGWTTTLIARAFVARAHATGKAPTCKKLLQAIARGEFDFLFFDSNRQSLNLNDHTSDRKTVIVKTQFRFMRRNSLAVPHTTQEPSLRVASVLRLNPLAPINFCLPIRKTGNKSPNVTR